ncbi:UvrD-helicase domain-containing protein [Paraburkholderia sediminicola]|uniref:UvrD-helicase domain-containing protein n=1 Tax=Paraburkholderia sediminicola TaxID=458836 RepID=UPI0038B9D8FC
MEFKSTDQQSNIINADLAPQCIIACPGSGKTATAVRRLLEVRRRLAETRGHIALFSYSNVAVETFRLQYKVLKAGMPAWANRVLIETADAFLTTYILRPHGAHVMGASRLPFLVVGNEPFLRGITIFDGTRPRSMDELRIRLLDDGNFEFSVQAESKKATVVDAKAALKAIEKMGRMGAYTYELARYWAIQTLVQNDRLCEILCRRFPHLLVDEAQDIGPLHGSLITIFAQGGSVVSLIGDPNQGIYDFAGADGTFLRRYAEVKGVVSFPLSENRRSMGAIVGVGNALAVTTSSAFRKECGRTHGCFYIRYDEGDLDALLATFAVILEANGYSRSEGIVLCRGNGTVEKLKGGASDVGRGATGKFAVAAVARDRNLDMASSFESATLALAKLLSEPSDTLHRDLLDASVTGEVKVLRRLLWGFIRNPATGLPDSRLRARGRWQPELKKRLCTFLDEVELRTSFRRSATWTNNVTLADVGDSPLWEADFAADGTEGIRIDTVHQAKGEGIPAVLYLARTADLNKLLGGTGTEDGRIGYVAITRAENLLIVAVPNTASKAVSEALEVKGFNSWPG